MDIAKLTGIAFACLIILILLKKLNSDYAVLASCIINIPISFLSFSLILPAFEYIRSLCNTEQTGSLITILFKSAGVCIICSFASEICRDCGEASLGTHIELFGKCTLIAYSLPVIREILGYAISFMD